MRTRTFMLAAALALASCSQQPPPEPATRAPEPPPRDVIAEVRAAAQGEDALDVLPARDPNAEDWRRQAERREAVGDLRGAAEALEEALNIAPDDPVLIQLAAEIALARGELDEAETLAYRSYEAGPQVGPLCRRNWAAIRIARELRGNEDAAEVAAEQARGCAHEPPVRM